MRASHGRTPSTDPQGFTLIELLIVVVIIGLLATMAVVGWGDMRERAHMVALRSDLVHVALEQELFFHGHMRYATLEELVDLAISEGVTPAVTWVGISGFAATVEHAALPGRSCGYYLGDAPAGSAGPATQAGQVVCD